jgi:Transport and Golgi organisation 2
MCTVSWHHTGEGYELLSNRDERHTRKPALAPSIQERRGVRFITPIDGDHGGSWIAVNEFGLTFCLLNRYACSLCQDSRPATSRGLLLMEVVDCGSLDEASDRIGRLKLESFKPFDLAILESGRPCLLTHWTGRDLHIEWDGEYAMPLVSSSFDQAGATTHRRRLFHKLADRRKITSALLREFHSSHSPVAGAYSPCMHREDASTVSFSRVRLARNRIEFCYFANSPCLRHASKPQVACLPFVRPGFSRDIATPSGKPAPSRLNHKRSAPGGNQLVI